MKRKELPKELKELVSWSVALLGQAIKEEYGRAYYQKMENTRKNLGKNWDGSHLNWKKDLKILQKEHEKLNSLSKEERRNFAHYTTCMLELINRCESAYRSFRLSGREQKLPVKKNNKIIFVLTAHPTEARGPEFLSVFSRIFTLLEEALHYQDTHSEKLEGIKDQLYHLLQMILKVPLTRSEKPKVSDEAKNIYNYTLKPEMLDLMIKIKQGGTNILLRTWAGGDKDGHPGVTEEAMLESFQLSRHDLLIFVKRRLSPVTFELDVMKNLTCRDQLLSDLKEIKKMTQQIEKIQDADGEKLLLFRSKVSSFKERYEEETGLKCQSLEDILTLLWLFPTLVLPLEVREDSEIVAESLKKPEDFAIGRMLMLLARISKGNLAKWYVRGFVLSMCEQTNDILNGIKLSEKILKQQSLPVVPLFETEKALANGSAILEELYSKKSHLIELHQEQWGGRFEVMLGYSDSSKESGVFPSRLLISKAMRQIDKTIRGKGLKPVFFHGSGGSVERGGGSIQEQTQWWPSSAINIFKATIQGEMVARTFSSPAIFTGQLQKIANEWERKRDSKKSPQTLKVMDKFSLAVQAHYQKTIQDEQFLKVIEQASPYMFLSHLKIGSRPSKRTSQLKVGGLRAIPWILCWTQTRVLFPTWWGVGSTWKNFDKEQKKQMKLAYKESDLMRSFVKLLGFTLEKVELAVWRMHLESSPLSQEVVDQTFELFLEEYQLALDFYQQVTGKKDLLWHRPWLEESIRLRSPMIHPLNLLQIIAVKEKDSYLLRKTVTGIACGMLTTG